MRSLLSLFTLGLASAPSFAWADGGCAGIFDGWDCFVTTLVVVAPLAFIAWVVSIAVGAAIMRSSRGDLLILTGVMAIAGLGTVIGSVWLFEQLQTEGLWELLVGPVLVFVEAVILATVLRRRASSQS